MGLLDRISGPRDLDALDDGQLTELATEIRAFLVDRVSQTGGHLGPNLGVVELTIALHRVFDSPRDQIVFDTGHQAYVHKILTGRADAFATLRTEGGLSGYPSRSESEHDVVENSHASTALSYADGLAKAHRLSGQQRTVVAVVGDGALTGGMAWEALNNIAAERDSRVVIVVNDNGRSYEPTVGGLATHLASLRTNPRYEQALELIRTRLNRTRLVGPPLYDALHAVKKGLKDALAPQGMFEDLGLKYVGPVDGHDIAALEQALHRAKQFGAPVIVHAITKKGAGYLPAEQHEEDNFHSLGAFDAGTGKVAASTPGYVDLFRSELVAIGAEREDVVALTAAMLYPTGLDGFQRAFPERTFDVGIAEQHAITSAAGMAMAGLHPVVALYSTFLNRAFDQMLLDVGLHRCAVTTVLVSAGITGPDGPSHHGMWDLSLLQIVPGLRVAAPRDGTRFRELLREAVGTDDGPTVVRVPKGAVPADMPAVESIDGVDILVRGEQPDVLVVAVGAMCPVAIDVAARLHAQGIGVTVADPRWLAPPNPALVGLASQHRLVVSVEDSGRNGGFGAAFGQALADANVERQVQMFGLPQAFHAHATRDSLLERCGLTAPHLAREITARAAASWAQHDITTESEEATS